MLDLYGTRNQVKDGKRAVCKECEKKRPVRTSPKPTSGKFTCSQCEIEKNLLNFIKINIIKMELECIANRAILKIQETITKIILESVPKKVGKGEKIRYRKYA